MRGRVVAAVLTAFVLVGCSDRAPPPQSLWEAYDKAVRLAAVKSPDAIRVLTPITQDEVVVVHVQTQTRIERNYTTWVALPDELRPLCRGKPDPVLALQMALGLPPKSQPDLKVFSFKVRRTDLFRPCASSASVEDRSCTLDINLASDDEHREFVLAQMMSSYRTEKGYPFTAMEQLSAHAFRAYRALVYETPDFDRYFREATVLEEIATLNIGSRPASRSRRRGIEDLRAIPWVFSWAQCRLMLPGWFGFGAAVAQWRADHPDDGLQRLQRMTAPPTPALPPCAPKLDGAPTPSPR